MLEGLFASALKDSLGREAEVSRSELESRVSSMVAPLSASTWLSKTDHIKLIAEIKRRSPSRGFLADIPDAGTQADVYATSGAHAISVLTEREGFGGSLEDIVSARKRVQIPILRKDFISNEYQILEARAAGADFVLLICAGLSYEDLKRLFEFATSLGMDVLVETHNEKEILEASKLGAHLIGINTRDLTTFRTDIGLFEKLAKLLPESAIRVAESSVKSVEDVVRYRNAGADVVLVGEALVTGDPKSLIPQFISVT